MRFSFNDKTPQIDPSCFIAPSANVIGDIIMGEESSVWFNVVIRADLATINVGKKSNIQDGSILHVDPQYPMTIGNHVTIGHKVMLHGCDIGDHSLIGMNSVILNGAKIGNNCIIGANSLVTENMEVPDGHLAMGSPAKVVKLLDEKVLTMLKHGAQHYVEQATLYKTKLVQLED